MPHFYECHDEVKQGLLEKKPILALESTLITHGLPYPHNLEIALASEDIARKNGVIPATIAIMDGKIKIGLSNEELQRLIEDKSAVKASVRDIPYILSKRLSAGTTVASTIYAAHHAGIKVLATGGIGGVHRGDAMDISADLIELAKTPMAVVCSGAKSILDLPKTLEFLETYSIPVVGYQTDLLPAFYSASSSYPLHARINEVPTLAEFLNIHWQLQLPAGVLIANPIPKENEIPNEVIEPAITNALKKAEHEKIVGKNITPFLLNEVRSATQNKSLTANIELIKNNVLLGSLLARALI